MNWTMASDSAAEDARWKTIKIFPASEHRWIIFIGTECITPARSENLTFVYFPLLDDAAALQHTCDETFAVHRRVFVRG